MDKGINFERKMVWKDSDGNPINLEGYSAHLHIKSERDNEVQLKLSTDNGKISLGDEGQIDIEIAPEDTEKIDEGGYMYDLVLDSNGGQRYRILKGVIYVNQVVTSFE